MNPVRLIGSLFGKKEVQTGQQFRDALNDPRRGSISYLTTTLQRALDFFDLMSKRRALLVFYEPGPRPNVNVEVKFLQDFGADIEKAFAFIGVLAASPERNLIVPFLPRTDLPIVVAFYFNELGKLTPIESLALTPDTLQNKAMIKAYLQKMSEVAERAEETYQRALTSLQAKIARQAGPSQQAYPDHFNDPYNAPYHDDDEEYEAQMRAAQDQSLRKQMSTDRHVKHDQDKAYEETLRKIQEEQRRKNEEIAAQKAEAEAQRAKQAAKEAFMAKLANEKVDPSHAITLQFRFPSGQKVVRDFDRRSPVTFAHMFAGTIENKGFENPQAEFELCAGFPPKKLPAEATLEAVFGGSDSEVVQVKEL